MKTDPGLGSRARSPETNPYIHNQRMFVKDANNSQWGNNGLQRRCWEIQISTCERVDFDPCPKAIYKTQLYVDKGLTKDLKL